MNVDPDDVCVVAYVYCDHTHGNIIVLLYAQYSKLLRICIFCLFLGLLHIANY